jgi:hypothetical protein
VESHVRIAVTGRHRETPVPVITAGEPEQGAWCPVCLLPTRLRVPLFADGRPCGGLEICPGCGTGHDRPASYVTPAAPQDRIVAFQATQPPAGWLRNLLHRGDGPGCAFGNCRRGGSRKHEYVIPADEGTYRYWFCRNAHRDAWCEANGLLPQG